MRRVDAANPSLTVGAPNLAAEFSAFEPRPTGETAGLASVDRSDRRERVLVTVVARIVILRALEPFVAAVAGLGANLLAQALPFLGAHGCEGARDLHVLAQVFQRLHAGD